jgi:hypothetical protein
MASPAISRWRRTCGCAGASSSEPDPSSSAACSSKRCQGRATHIAASEACSVEARKDAGPRGDRGRARWLERQPKHKTLNTHRLRSESVWRLPRFFLSFNGADERLHERSAGRPLDVGRRTVGVSRSCGAWRLTCPATAPRPQYCASVSSDASTADVHGLARLALGLLAFDFRVLEVRVRLGIGLGLGRRARKLVVQPLTAGRRRHRAGAGSARLRAGPGEVYGAKQAKSNTQILIQDPAAEATWRAGKPRHQRHAGAFRLLDEAIAQTESRQALRHAGNSAESWPSAQASRK